MIKGQGRLNMHPLHQHEGDAIRKRILFILMLYQIGPTLKEKWLIYMKQSNEEAMQQLVA